MTVVYLEPDDEITTAIARLRALTDREAVVIVPPGSRIATSRINFKLLAREANERKLNIAAVSDDPAVRAVAISAGLPTYDSIGAAEQALANFKEQDRQLAERIGDRRESAEAGAPKERHKPSWSSAPPLETRVMPVVEAPDIDGRAESVRNSAFAEGHGGIRAAGENRGAEYRGAGTQVLPPFERPETRSVRRRSLKWPLIVFALIAVLLAGVAYGAYVFLPTATIALTPQTGTLRVDTFTVIADPHTAVVDPVSGTLPAQSITIPIQVSDTFAATGSQFSDTKATGVVRFHSENTDHDVSVTAGTFVATADDIEFITTEAALVPKADFATSTPGTVNVPIRAVRSGPTGNVDKGMINLAPKSLSTQLVSVNNPAPTDGGTRTEAKVVTQADYDGAVATLTNRLDHALAVALEDPNAIPGGLTAYPGTATHNAPTPDQEGSALVGAVAPNFDLSLAAGGQVQAVNESLIDQIAATRLDGALGPQQQKLGQPTYAHSAGEVADGLIRYEVDASILTYTAPDLPTLVSSVRGKTVKEAQDILDQYGTVNIVIWPEFIDRLPDQVSRISLTVTTPTAGS
ncbi:MAG: baseplate J/gp47 family protein [Chloroflexota bacterium]